MEQLLIYPVGSSESCRYATGLLEKSGISLTDHPSPEITHLLLDIPSKDDSGLKELLRMLPKRITVIGGYLNHDILRSYHSMDLLKDPYYLAKNAAITADCALKVASQYLRTTFADAPTLVLGWGRIGKCLSGTLKALECPVTVAARKDADRAMLEALGYQAVDFSDIPSLLAKHCILFNTVPDLPLHGDTIDNWTNGIAIDLASAPGMQGTKVIPARGLPGKYAPESSGRLICDTILRRLKEEST